MQLTSYGGMYWHSCKECGNTSQITAEEACKSDGHLFEEKEDGSKACSRCNLTYTACENKGHDFVTTGIWFSDRLNNSGRVVKCTRCSHEEHDTKVIVPGRIIACKDGKFKRAGVAFKKRKTVDEIIIEHEKEMLKKLSENNYAMSGVSYIASSSLSPNFGYSSNQNTISGITDNFLTTNINRLNFFLPEREKQNTLEKFHAFKVNTKLKKETNKEECKNMKLSFKLTT
jgi:hypothetical protein